MLTSTNQEELNTWEEVHAEIEGGYTFVRYENLSYMSRTIITLENIQHNDVSFGRVVGHRIVAETLFIVLVAVVPDFEFVPVGTETFFNLEILELDVVFGHVDLNITAGLEVQVHAGRKIDDQFFDKGVGKMEVFLLEDDQEGDDPSTKVHIPDLNKE
jgi:hypothetical protein